MRLLGEDEYLVAGRRWSLCAIGKGCKNLKSLSDCYFLSDMGLEAVAAGFSEPAHLEVNGWHNIGTYGLESIERSCIHTAAIAAGNNGIPVQVQGCEIVVYKALYRAFGGFVADVVASIDQAVYDGVDILNLSLRQDLVDLTCFYGMAGANNDINVLDNSPLFDDLLDDLAPVVPYVVNGVQYRNGYYLADGIYPEWASFVKSFTVATDPKHTYVKHVKTSAETKDVEPCFSVFSKDHWGLNQQPPVQLRSQHNSRRNMGSGVGVGSLMRDVALTWQQKLGVAKL
ncbi:ALP1-like protein [Tanacetum coccineum]